MTADLPPQAVMECPAEVRMDKAGSQEVLAAMRQKLPGTKFVSAAPAPICGMVMLTTDTGNTVFTDKAGRYFVIGLMLDTATGRTLDGTKQLN
jgi:hypothetical protein